MSISRITTAKQAVRGMVKYAIEAALMEAHWLTIENLNSITQIAVEAVDKAIDEPLREAKNVATQKGRRK